MKRILSLILTIFVVTGVLLALGSCGDTTEPKKLATPVVTIENGIATWTRVEGAIGYDVGIGSEITRYKPGFNTAELEIGESIIVRAVGDGKNFATSDWSRQVTRPEPLAAPVLTLSGNTVSWSPVAGALSYQISIGTAEPIDVNADVTSYVLQEGDTVVVRAHFGKDGAGPWSNAVTYSTSGDGGDCTHADSDNNGECDICYEAVVVVIDIYAINDLHGKFCDSDGQPGVDELTTYLKSREDIDDNVIVLSSGDMWQGTAESGLTFGKLITEWMNIVGTVSMTLGNHEYDWGEKYIKDNLEIAEFPFLAINIYDKSTGERVDYCQPSVMVEEGGIQIGIIGAIGDCYSSILSDMVTGVEFKVGSALTALVKDEAERLRALGADLIVYSLHDGTSGYDTALSDGYVDIVFEGHTHSAYTTTDSYGIYHIQGGGENKGISHAELRVNHANGKVSVSEAGVIYSNTYSSLEDDAECEALEEKYRDTINKANEVLGRNSTALSDSEVEDLVAKLYYEAGIAKWGERYDITLGGGFLKTRSPYDLAMGKVTYSDLMSILPFNNEIVLCSVSGYNLLSRFINNDNSDYHVYGNYNVSDIVAGKTYYVVVDSYTSAYRYNNLTEVERYDTETFARDLLAEYIRSGGLDTAHQNCAVKTVEQALDIGASIPLGVTTEESFHVSGIIKSIVSPTYGNLYLTDEHGNEIYVYGLYDADGVRYDAMTVKPAVGDTVTLCAKIQNYNNGGASLIELKSAVIVEASKPEITPKKELATPSINLEGEGVRWSAVEGAVGYEIYIGTSHFSFDTTISYVPLSDGDTFKVRALGDGVNYEAEGEWSEVITYVAPSTPKPLATPLLSLNGSVAIWEPIEGAVGYEININGISTVYNTVISEVTLASGDTLKIRALGDGTSYAAEGEWSNPVTYVRISTLNTPVVRINDGYAIWDAVDGAVGYEIKINDNDALQLEANITSYALTDSCTVSVRAIAEVGSNNRDSAWSAPLTYTSPDACTHVDSDNDGECDACYETVVVVIDIYAINDLHGKFCDTDTQPGVDELTTYLKSREDIDDNVIVLSSGDMWQGTAESGLTFGKLITEWMNIVGTVSMTLGNHEYDWGEKYIKDNLEIAEFPFLAINIYDKSTGERVDYCQPSVMVEEGGIQIGIIGAIGDCYSSILSDMVTGVEFKVGSALTALVKDEAERLRALGADLIVYSLHDGTSGYDTALSDGYVDIVFEGHTHSAYTTTDSHGIYHIQGGGENKGISHAELRVNHANGKVSVSEAGVIYSNTYSSLEDDAECEALEEKYRDVINKATVPLGTNSTYRSGDALEELVAKLYYDAGVAKWGSKYAITLGGGYLNTRSPGSLSAGSVSYGDLMSLFPFNNQIVLCSVSGSDLLSKFINTSNGNYHVYGEYDASNISSSGIYYIIVDSYTSAYSYNNLTVVEYYDETTYARDLLAEYIKAGGLEGSIPSNPGTSTTPDDTDYTLTEIEEALSIGAALDPAAITSDYYYVKGTVDSIASTFYGNMYLSDGNGNAIYVYGLYTADGTIYNGMTTKPQVGDTIIVKAPIQNYYSGGVSLIELKSAVLIEIL